MKVSANLFQLAYLKWLKVKVATYFSVTLYAYAMKKNYFIYKKSCFWIAITDFIWKLYLINH